MSSITARPALVKLSLAGTAAGAELMTLLKSLGYHANAVAEVLAFVEANHTAEGCPSLDPDDEPLLAFVLRRRLPELVRTAEVLAAGAEAVAGDARSWPSWADDFCYVPTEADRGWAAAAFEADESARLGAALDAMADEAEALASLTRGLTAPDPTARGRSPRSRPVSPGCWGDDDQRRAFGHV